MRGRGLKLNNEYLPCQILYVAPHAGAWIETPLQASPANPPLRRPSCGGVD